jgi:regulator of sirC expression with transglutaminase-like and TPR domain
VCLLQHAYPDLDPSSVKQQLDELAAEVEAGLPEGVRYPLRVIKEINRVLYQVGTCCLTHSQLLPHGMAPLGCHVPDQA